MTNDPRLQIVVEMLQRALQVGRVTLRQDVADQFYPVTHEAVASGVNPLMGDSVPGTGGATVEKLLRDRTTLVMRNLDMATSGGDAEYTRDSEYFAELSADYGGMRAFIATPVFDGDALRAIISVHELTGPREWTAEEVRLAEVGRDQVHRIVVDDRRDDFDA